MSDDHPRHPRRPPRDLSDDDVVDIPPDTLRHPVPPRPREPFPKLALTQSEQLAELVMTQRSMALQLSGLVQMTNRRFDILHEENALMRHGLEELVEVVKQNHAPRLDKVESTLGQKVAKGGGIVGLLVVALPLLAEVLPKWAGVFERIGSLLQ